MTEPGPLKLRTGTAGLFVAMTLYGADCVRSYGDWLTPAEITIPREDAEAFSLLVSEVIDKRHTP